jgi:hypothetical protein
MPPVLSNLDCCLRMRSGRRSSTSRVARPVSVMWVAAARAMAASKPGGAAYAAARPRGKPALAHLGFQLHGGAQAHIDDVRPPRAAFDGLDVLGRFDDPFSIQEAGGQTFVIPGGSHGGAEGDRFGPQRVVVQLKFERRLHHHPIVLVQTHIRRGAQHAHAQGPAACGRLGRWRGRDEFCRLMEPPKFCRNCLPMIPFQVSGRTNSRKTPMSTSTELKPAKLPQCPMAWAPRAFMSPRRKIPSSGTWTGGASSISRPASRWSIPAIGIPR